MLKTQEPDSFRNIMKELIYLAPALLPPHLQSMDISKTNNPALPLPYPAFLPFFFFFVCLFLRKERNTTESFTAHIRKEIIHT